MTAAATAAAAAAAAVGPLLLQRRPRHGLILRYRRPDPAWVCGLRSAVCGALPACLPALVQSRREAHAIVTGAVRGGSDARKSCFVAPLPPFDEKIQVPPSTHSHSHYLSSLLIPRLCSFAYPRLACPCSQLSRHLALSHAHVRCRAVRVRYMYSARLALHPPFAFLSNHLYPHA